MIKKVQKNVVRKPRAAVLAQTDLARVAGGNPPGSKIKETLVGD